MGNNGFDDDFPRIFRMAELDLRNDIQIYVWNRFVSKDKIKEKIAEYQERLKTCANDESKIKLDIIIKAYQELL